MYTLLTSPMLATCLTLHNHFILPDSFILKIFQEKRKLRSFSLWIFYFAGRHVYYTPPLTTQYLIIKCTLKPTINRSIDRSSYVRPALQCYTRFKSFHENSGSHGAVYKHIFYPGILLPVVRRNPPTFQR